MTAVYTLGQLDELKAEYLSTLDDSDDELFCSAQDVASQGLEGFFTWLDLRERGPEPTLDEALVALSKLAVLAKSTPMVAPGHPDVAAALGILARVRK